jgi:hypothetical protein
MMSLPKCFFHGQPTHTRGATVFLNVPGNLRRVRRALCLKKQAARAHVGARGAARAGRQERVVGVRAHGDVPQGAGGARQVRVDAVVPPAAVPRHVSARLLEGVLEDGEARPVCPRPPAHPAVQRLGAPVAGDPRVDPEEVRRASCVL